MNNVMINVWHDIWKQKIDTQINENYFTYTTWKEVYTVVNDRVKEQILKQIYE